MKKNSECMQVIDVSPSRPLFFVLFQIDIGIYKPVKQELCILNTWLNIFFLLRNIGRLPKDIGKPTFTLPDNLQNETIAKFKVSDVLRLQCIREIGKKRPSTYRGKWILTWFVNSDYTELTMFEKIKYF